MTCEGDVSVQARGQPPPSSETLEKSIDAHSLAFAREFPTAGSKTSNRVVICAASLAFYCVGARIIIFSRDTSMSIRTTLTAMIWRA